MTSTTFLPLVYGLSLLLCVAEGPPPEKRPRAPRATARVYTNDDLDRVRPFRDELGARSVPAEAPRGRESGDAVASPRGARVSGGPSTRDEVYWRREAEKLRERLRVLAYQRDGLRERLSERREDERRVLRRGRGSRAAGSGSDRALEARIAAIERRMRELEEDLAERARRAGALPGWLR